MMAEKATKDATASEPPAPAQDDQAPDQAQDLPPTHPNDPTETTLTQDAGPDEDARREAIAKRTGEGA